MKIANVCSTVTEKEAEPQHSYLFEQAERNTVWSHARNRSSAYPFHVRSCAEKKPSRSNFVGGGCGALLDTPSSVKPLTEQHHDLQFPVHNQGSVKAMGRFHTLVGIFGISRARQGNIRCD